MTLFDLLFVAVGVGCLLFAAIEALMYGRVPGSPYDDVR